MRQTDVKGCDSGCNSGCDRSIGQLPHLVQGKESLWNLSSNWRRDRWAIGEIVHSTSHCSSRCSSRCSSHDHCLLRNSERSIVRGIENVSSLYHLVKWETPLSSAQLCQYTWDGPTAWRRQYRMRTLLSLLLLLLLLLLTYSTTLATLLFLPLWEQREKATTMCRALASSWICWLSSWWEVISWLSSWLRHLIKKFQHL